MATPSAQDKDRRINLSLNRLITQIIPPDEDAGVAETREKQAGYAEAVRAILKE